MTLLVAVRLISEILDLWGESIPRSELHQPKMSKHMDVEGHTANNTALTEVFCSKIGNQEVNNGPYQYLKMHV